MNQSATSPSKQRLPSLDVLKGLLSLKIAISHLGFFVAVPAMYHAVGLGRSVTFPALLFAFGVGTSLSKRRKPVWPFFVLLATMLVGSLVREGYLDYRIAMGYPTSQHPLDGGLLQRFADLITFSHAGHYADFLQVYVVMLGVALLADRLRRPLSSWNAWILVGAAVAVNVAGTLLHNAGVTGPLSALWNDGFRTMQYAPLFAFGILAGNYLPKWMAMTSRPRYQAALLFVSKIAALKFLEDGLDRVRRMLGDSGDLWKHGGLELSIGGAILALLMISAAADLVVFARGPVADALQKVGKRTIVSLCLQLVIIPLAGVVALQMPNPAYRMSFAIGVWTCLVVILLNWDQIVAQLGFGPKRISEPLPAEPLVATSEKPLVPAGR